MVKTMSAPAKAGSRKSHGAAGANRPVPGKRAVLVVDFPFWRFSHGSHTRVRGLATYLANAYQLTVFYAEQLSAAEKAGFDALGLPGAQIVSRTRYSTAERNIPKKLRQLMFFKKASHKTLYAFRTFLDENPAQIVVFEYIHLAYLIDACSKDCATILDMHDVMSQRMAKLEVGGLKARIRISAAEEREILGVFDRVLAISRADQAYLLDWMNLGNVVYVPASVDGPPRARNTSPFRLPTVSSSSGSPVRPAGRHARTLKRMPTGDPSGRRVLFMGANSKTNVTGLRWFLDQVWPIVGAQGFTLDVLGLIGSSFPDPPDGVTVHGCQRDIGRFLSRANMSINPNFVGGGLKIKCVESLVYGLPCITTAEGAAGLEKAQLAGLYIARSRMDFACRMLQLADDPDERWRIAQLGPLFVKGEFSKQRAYCRLDAWLKSSTLVQGT